jgi:hypothetical protein
MGPAACPRGASGDASRAKGGFVSTAAEVIGGLRKKNEAAWELAVLASTAVQVEPELLRRLRLDLLAGSDASAEADLWLSELVDSKSPDAAVLRPDVRAALQQELAEHARRDDAVKIVATLHAGHSKVIQLQEEVTALSLLNDDASRAKIETLLQPVVRTLHESDHAGLARWAARAFTQLRPDVQSMPAPWSMMRAASLRLRGTSSSSASGAGWSAVESSLRDLPLVPVYVRMRRDGATVTTAPGDGARMEIPATEPLLLEFAWDGRYGARQSTRVTLAQGDETEVALVPRAVTVTTVLGDEWEIRVPPQFDDWALVMTARERGDASAPAYVFLKWLVDPAGGAMRGNQCHIIPFVPPPVSVAEINEIVHPLLRTFWASSYRHRRLYVYIEGLFPDRVLDESQMRAVLDPIRHSFEEIIIFGEISLGTVTRFDELSQAGLFCGINEPVSTDPDGFAGALVKALNGGAAADDGAVTAEGLTTYLKPRKQLPQEAWPHWQTWGELSPLVASDDFAVCVAFEGYLGPQVHIRDGMGKVVVTLPFAETGKRRRLLRGLYLIDDPSRFLLLRLDTTESREGRQGLIVAGIDHAPREEWIIVAGTAGEFTEPQRLFATAVARRLAGAGYRLLVGDWRGVDEITLDAFTKTLEVLGIRTAEFIRRFRFRPPRTRERLPEVTEVIVDSLEDEFARPIREAYAIVLIGGLGGTYRYAVEAARAGVPILPIAPTGGDASTLFREYLAGGSSGELYEIAAERAGAPGFSQAIRESAWQRSEIRDEAQADEMAIRAVELLLDHIKPWRRTEEAASPATAASEWQDNVATLMPRICRVEVSAVSGTGFLVGPRAVMTAYHIVADVINGNLPPNAMAFHFDESGRSGFTYRATRNWLIDSAPDDDPTSAFPGGYAVIQLDEAIGDGPIPLRKERRGWIALPSAGVALPRVQESIHILYSHRPAAQFTTGTVIGYDRDGKYLIHRMPTEAGSSGAPCFDADWNLVGMQISYSANTGQNAALSMHAVAERLRRHGLLHRVLSEESSH